MEKITDKLTIFFDNPFWAGVFEHIEKINFLYVKLYSEQNLKIVKYMNSF